MKRMRIVHGDAKERVNHTREACRGLVLRGGDVLLMYESNNGKYITPGGGREEGETPDACCAREMLEETGREVEPVRCFLVIEEYFDDWKHINRYYLCRCVRDTGHQQLTPGEKKAGYTPVWMPLQDALREFGRYEELQKTSPADAGLYVREYKALKEFGRISEAAAAQQENKRDNTF